MAGEFNQLFENPEQLEMLIQQLGQLLPAPPLQAAQNGPMAPQAALGELMQPAAQAPPPNPFDSVPLPAAPAAPGSDAGEAPVSEEEAEARRRQAALAALAQPVGNVPQPPAVDPNFRGRATAFPAVGGAAGAGNRFLPHFQGFPQAALGPSLGQLMALAQRGQ